MTTQSYYKDRLGFDPNDPKENTGLDPTLHGYEENLSKFKDERDAIQKKTFTKWVNKHLKKAGRRIDDLFEDLRDGHNLVSLLEVLAGERLPRERGRMRFHMLQNVQTCLDYLRYRKIKLVNIRADDIVDGNPKLILGLIWTIILHFQISDIMVGQDESVTAREALLRWAQRTTAKYPGVRVHDFTSSWRDGLAFNAIIHRNRPDLVDWRSLRHRQVRDRLDSAFHVVERDYGVTRLLDPEDVDTPEPDEKSLITYISSLYDVFPEPPKIHPLYDPETQRKYQEYREISTALLVWMREHISLMSDRSFPPTLIEMKKLLAESNRFRMEDVPPRSREKQKLAHLFRDIEKFLEETQEKLETELRPESIERMWNHLMSLHQERDQAIHEEIQRLERLQRIAEKVHREAKQTEAKLEEIEQRIDEEAKRLDRLHPQDAKANCDAINVDVNSVEEAIQAMFADVQTLKDGRYNQASELHKRVQRLHQRWLSLRTLFQSRLLSVLPSLTVVDSRQSRSSLEARLFQTNEHFRFLYDCSEWVRSKLKLLDEAEYGTDLPSVQVELESHQKEHRAIDKFQTNMEKCINAKSKFQGEELSIYVQHLTILQKNYNELLVLSNKRLADLDTLLDFIQSATSELIWLNEKEETELARDWSAKNLNVLEIERYYEALMSELEKREIQFSAVQDRGEALVLQHHPASKCVEAYMAAMQTQWSWLLQLTLCLETHLRHAAVYHSFFNEVHECEQWVMKHDELLNSVYSKADFTLDEGERLLRDMQELREDLSRYGDLVQSLNERSREVVPLKQRRLPVKQPIHVTSICAYKHMNLVISKEEKCQLINNTQKAKWKIVNSSGVEGMVPSVCFLIPPPDPEATEAADKLKRQYDRCVALWQKKQLRMRQNMIFATIKVVKSWDLAQFLAMGKEQRDAIRRALNEDAEKLLQEGDPNDPQLRRLQREMDEVNKLFDEFERRAAMGEDGKKTPAKGLSDQLSTLQTALEDAERTLTSRVTAPLPRDLDQLEQLVLQHKAFETQLHALEPELESAKKSVQTGPRKPATVQTRLDVCIDKWNGLWMTSRLYVERLKAAEMALSDLEEATNLVSEFEMRLAGYDKMPSELDALRNVHEDLLGLQNSIQSHQSVVDTLHTDVVQVRHLVENSRQAVQATVRKHPDVDRLEAEVSSVTARWSNVCTQVVERLQSCEVACELLQQYQTVSQASHSWLDGMTEKAKKLGPLENGVQARSQVETTLHLYNGVTERKVSMEEANAVGARLIREAKQAMEEKYKLCDDSIAKLLSWMTNVESQLANQEMVREDIAELKNQINVVKGIRDDVGGHNKPVNHCLDQARLLLVQGGDVLSAEELATLERNAEELKHRYDRSNDQTDKVLRKLGSALDELTKFRTELTTFKTWLSKSTKTLEERERWLGNLNRIQTSTEANRELISDVIAHQADLRFITMAAQKYLDESKDHLQVLNQFRTSLPQRLSHIEPKDSVVKQEVADAAAGFQDLVKRANRLSDKMAAIGSKQKEYHEAVTKAKTWLKDVEPKTNKIVNEPLGAEPKTVEDQLNRAKALNHDFMASERLIENTRQAAAGLLHALEGDIPEVDKQNLEGTPVEIEEKYRRLSVALADKCQLLDTALVQSQGVQEALDTLNTWLGQTENQLKNASKPASLSRERLEEQIREHRQIAGDVESKKPSFDSINQATAQLIANPDNARIARKIDTKMKDMNLRFEKLQERVEKRGEALDETLAQLEAFQIQVNQFEEWYLVVVETLESPDVLRISAEQMAQRVEDAARQRDARKGDYDELMKNGKSLVAKKDVIDTTPIREKMKTLEVQWKDLNAIIDESQKDGRARIEQLTAYEKLRDQVVDWLERTERRVEHLEPVAVDAETLKKQTEEIKPLVKEHRDYGPTVERVVDLGNSYDAILKGERPESPRRRSSASPTKRPSITTLRRPSQDIRSPSPTKTPNGQSPLTNSASSGFSSRRSSQDGYVPLEDASPVQQQLNEICHRYSLLGTKLGDRQSELDSMKEEAKKHSEALRTLAAFLDKTERQLPRDSLVPQTKEDAEKQLRSVKNLLEDMYEKQPQLDSLKNQVTDLLRRKANVPGAAQLHEDVSTVSGRWKEVQDRCKQKARFLEDVKDFHDTYEQLSSWLVSKDRMMSVLGPIASDPRLVHNQLQQVQVLREEFKSQEPQVQQLEHLADVLLQQAEPSSPDGRRINDKMAVVSAKWSDLIGRLEDRKQSLDAASGTSRQFYANLGQLQDALQRISDELDDLAVEKAYPEELLNKLDSLEEQLEFQRPLLAEVEAVSEQLCAILSDASSKAEISHKLGQVDKMHNQLQKKLDNRKAELENLLRDSREFGAQCNDLQDWLNAYGTAVQGKLLVSADRERLKQQLQDAEPVYKEVMSKEHEVIMMLDKGHELVAQSPSKNDARALQKTLESIKAQWDHLRQQAMERHTRLQTSSELCRKFDNAEEAFLPWLTQAERKLSHLPPVAFQKSELDQQLKEIHAFRNELSRHSAAFETHKGLGETFLKSCDADKEGVKNELTSLQKRWDDVNTGILERSQSLEDISQRVGEFTEHLRDAQHALQRVEDRLASHDALGNAAKDSKLLDRVKAILDEAVKLEKGVDRVQDFARGLVTDAHAHGSDASHIGQQAQDLAERYGELKNQLQERCQDLETSSQALAQYNEQVKAVSGDLSALEAELNEMQPPARNMDSLKSQLDEIHEFMDKLDNQHHHLEAAFRAGAELVSQGHAQDAQVTKEQLDGLKNQAARIGAKARAREEEVVKVMRNMEDFYQLFDNVIRLVDDATREERSFKPIGGDVDLIRQQQAEFRAFCDAYTAPLQKEVEEANRLGQGLVKSAANGVSTSALESDLEKMNDRWNNLKAKLHERERRLDVGLLQSGKFKEALEGLSKWLSDTEEMVANQKPPSADYKVVKAQLQEQKFLKKLLLDRQQSMSSLLDMGHDLAAHADSHEKKEIEEQLQELVARFDALTASADDRMGALQKTMSVAKDFQDQLTPILDWLEKMEKKIKDMETVPTDEEKIQQKIEEHDLLHDDILRQKPAFDALADVATALMALVGDEEAAGLADRLADLTDRYGSLVEQSEALGRLLCDAKSGLRHLVLSYEDLLAWMEDMEVRLARYRVLSVHVEKLLEQMDELTDLTEEVAGQQKPLDDVVDTGLELMPHISNEEALQLKDKLDSVQRRYAELTNRGSDLLKQAQDTLPLVQTFHTAHNQIADWCMDAEKRLQAIESSGGSSAGAEADIELLESELADAKTMLETVNISGPQLCQRSPGEGATFIESLVTRDNRRFDAICEQIQRKAERIHLSKQRSMEVVGDLDELLDWFRDTESQLTEAEPPSSDPDVIRVQLKEHKALSEDISSQKGRVRDVLSAAKKVLREGAQSGDKELIREKMDDLKDTMEHVSQLSSDRLSVLEQALPLAEHFFDAHAELSHWLDDMEAELPRLDTPALRADQIVKQQEGNKALLVLVNEHKPLVDKLNKTGSTLAKLCLDEEGARVHDIMDNDNARYNAVRSSLRERQQALEEALQETSQFSDKLDGMLAALASTAEQVKAAEPVSAHPDKIQEQIADNQAVVEDLEKRESAFEAVKRAADDVISKAGTSSDPAVKDIKSKLERLSSLWDHVLAATGERGRSLEEALAVAERFWDELQGVMAALRDLQETLQSQDPPAVEPATIQHQQEVLQEIKQEIEQTKPEVEQCRQTGQDLMALCGEPDKPEVKKHIEDLDHAWDNITALYARREENLIDAMEKAMEFHDTLNDLLEFLEAAEKKFGGMKPLGSDIETVKDQIEQLKNFKAEVDPQMVKVEALNRQASELTERTTPDQAAVLKEPLNKVNKRWEDLLQAMVERQRELEHALLRLGQFQHALTELLVWIQRTDANLDELKPVFGDPNVIEVELAKLKVLVNDIQAHQTSVDTLNDAGRQLVETDRGSVDANATQQRLTLLNRKWNDLLEKSSNRQKELEDALREAQAFNAEIQDLLLWLSDIDGALTTSKPVGGLPETASEQLQRFMEVYNELEQNRAKVESVLQQGADYLKRSTDGAATSLQQNLRTLKQRWDNVMNRANDKKIKLEIALKEATEFHEALQAFVNWLTDAEKTLSNLKPVSRVLDTILGQIEDHKNFQKDIGAQREVMISLDKKGTHLKYFSQKQDVILIKNLLISVQHRWERVLSKAAERTRALDLGYKEAKEFHDAWSDLYKWLDDAEKSFDDLVMQLGNDPTKIKNLLAKHKEFQRTLAGKQPTYDATMRLGKSVKERAPKTDEPVIKDMLSDLKNKWQTVCNKSVDRQRKLEEGLLFSGQFKDALQALVDWLCKADALLVEDGPVHGDLDTVMALREQHKTFEEELANRATQADSVRKTAQGLLASAGPEDVKHIQGQLDQLNSTWDKVNMATKKRAMRLDDALTQAEALHKAVNMLLEWLSDAEMKLRFAGPLPDDEHETREQMLEHDKFMAEMGSREGDKDKTLALAQDILSKCHPDAVTVIRHWITIIQSRWEEVTSWAKQRHTRLEDHLKLLREMATLLEELMAWLQSAENSLITLEAEPLPDDLPSIEGLLNEHQNFMEGLAARQPEVDRVCKTKQPKLSVAGKDRKQSRAKSTASAPDREVSLSPTRESSPEHDVRRMRLTPERDSYYTRFGFRKISYVNRAPSRESTPGPQQRKPSQASTVGHDGRETSPMRDYPKPWMAGASRASPGRETSPEAWPHIGPRFASTPALGPNRKGSKVSTEVTPKNPRARQLWDKWRNVWMMSWERQRRLQDKLAYLQELEKVKNFSWDDWRRRFVKYMNNKKSRVTDLFRKMDKNNDGTIPREDFVEGIIRTKFPTSRMEMNAVANMFDRNNEGYIDWREFIAALRPDWEEKVPETDAEKIHDEVKRQVQKCTCRNRFKVMQVGEGKYRFGDSQKLRLVRILRSTVMVRVGGGWVALDEFLVKNDPCRAKGRTNIELREQFILAEGVSQGMTPFKAKPSPSNSVSGPPGQPPNGGSTPTGLRSQSLPTAGPITKVRERSLRSVPMGTKSRGASFSAGTPDSSTSEGDSSFRLHQTRKASAPARTMTNTSGSLSGSRPPSRSDSKGSRPPSRHGSSLSLDSTDDSCARTPSGMRRTPSFHRGSASSNQSSTPSRTPSQKTHIAFGSSTLPRKASTPVTSNGSSHRQQGDTPSGINGAQRSRILRTTSASSIPSLTGQLRTRTGSATSLAKPQPLGSTSRSRTPSTSNIPVMSSSPRTPVSASSASKLTRQPSNLSDAPSPSLRKPSTPLTQRKASGAEGTPTGLRKPSTTRGGAGASPKY